MEYAVGHVKRNTVTGEVAIRNIFPLGTSPQQMMMEWLCAAVNTGPRNTWTTEVEGTDWVDLFVPESNVAEPLPPVEPPAPPA